jgi:hypothetical protein
VELIFYCKLNIFKCLRDSFSSLLSPVILYSFVYILKLWPLTNCKSVQCWMIGSKWCTTLYGRVSSWVKKRLYVCGLDRDYFLLFCIFIEMSLHYIFTFIGYKFVIFYNSNNELPCRNCFNKDKAGNEKRRILEQRK